VEDAVAAVDDQHIGVAAPGSKSNGGCRPGQPEWWR
jgi:hypothetical protein